MDNAIHWINRYPTDNDKKTKHTIHWIVIYPVDSVICSLNNRGLAFTILHRESKDITTLYSMTRSCRSSVFISVVTLNQNTCSKILDQIAFSNDDEILANLSNTDAARGWRTHSSTQQIIIIIINSASFC